MSARVRPMIVLLAALSAGVIATSTSPGCSSDSDVDFTCTPNVTKDGIKVVTNGCADFAVCTDKNGNQQDPHTCCASRSSDITEAECLYGYGVTSEGGGGSGGTTTTTSSPSSGGSDGSGGSDTGGKGGSGGKG